MPLEITFSKVHFLFTFLIVINIVGSEVLSRGRYRRDEEILQTETQNTQITTPSSPVEPKLDNVQLVTPPNPLQSENIIPNDANLQEVAADVPNAISKLNDPVAVQSQVKTKVATHNVQYVQDQTAAQWPMGIVPFVIDKEIYDGATISRIVEAMGVVESSSCVLFKELKKTPHSEGNAWLHISNPRQERECVHETSSSDFGGIMVVLGIECLHPDEILHSILHGIGFKDEVSHPHRDQYIRIMWENIQPKYRQLFRIQHEDAPYKLVEYDPLSIMHFHDRAFSANGAATIAPRIPGLQIGSTLYPHTLSQLDIMKLKLSFGHECNKRKIGDLLDTCKKALLPKHVDDHEDTKEHIEKNADDDKDHTSADAQHVNNEDHAEDTSQDLRQGTDDPQNKLHHKHKHITKKALNENDKDRSHKYNHGESKGLKKSQRRRRYSYRRE